MCERPLNGACDTPSSAATRPISGSDLLVFVACFPRGRAGAHQVWNGSDFPIRVLMLSTLVTPDIVEYLDTGKVGARSVAVN